MGKQTSSPNPANFLQSIISVHYFNWPIKLSIKIPFPMQESDMHLKVHYKLLSNSVAILSLIVVFISLEKKHGGSPFLRLEEVLNLVKWSKNRM